MAQTIETEISREWSLPEAFGSLVVTFVVAAATLSVLGLSLHALNHRFSFTLVRALHQPWAWVSVLVLSATWLGTGLVHQIRTSRRGQAESRRILPVRRNPGRTTSRMYPTTAGFRLTGQAHIGRVGMTDR